MSLFNCVATIGWAQFAGYIEFEERSQSRDVSRAYVRLFSRHNREQVISRRCRRRRHRRRRRRHHLAPLHYLRRICVSRRMYGFECVTRTGNSAGFTELIPGRMLDVCDSRPGRVAATCVDSNSSSILNISRNALEALSRGQKCSFSAYYFMQLTTRAQCIIVFLFFNETTEFANISRRFRSPVASVSRYERSVKHSPRHRHPRSHREYNNNALVLSLCSVGLSVCKFVINLQLNCNFHNFASREARVACSMALRPRYDLRT